MLSTVRDAMIRLSLGTRSLAAALVLGAAAHAQAPDVRWEFVGVDSAKVRSLALVDPADGQPYGMPHPVFANLSFPNIPEYYDYERGVYRLDDPAGGEAEPEPVPAWTVVTNLNDPYSLYADPTGLVLAGSGRYGRLDRSTDGGDIWSDVGSVECYGDVSDPRIVRTYGPGRERTIWIVGDLCRSDDEGATWAPVPQLSAPVYLRRRDLIELPSSALLPEGRLLMGVGNGVLLSNDNGQTWTASSLYEPFRWVGDDFVLVPSPFHPYGGVLYLLAYDFYFESQSYNVVMASDDGGARWEIRHRFVYGEYGLSRIDGNPEIVALGDGSLVVGLITSGSGSARDLGTILWSGDGGVTWHSLGSQPPWLGSTPPDGVCNPACEGGMWPGWGAHHLRVDREGRIWAGTDNDVWRTTGPAWAVASEDAPATPPAPQAGSPTSVAVSVWPNPTGGAVTVGLSLAEPQAVRVSVVDALGREVAVVHEGAAADGQRLAVDTGGWPVGAYTVRVVTEAGQASAGLTVVR